MERKITLSEKEIPEQWYNVIADMPNKPLPPLHPGTLEPIGPEALAPLFPMELIKQEGVSRTILINLCGHGNFDMKAYQDYFAGNIVKHELTQKEIEASIAKLNTPHIP